MRSEQKCRCALFKKIAWIAHKNLQSTSQNKIASEQVSLMVQVTHSCVLAAKSNHKKSIRMQKNETIPSNGKRKKWQQEICTLGRDGGRQNSWSFYRYFGEWKENRVSLTFQVWLYSVYEAAILWKILKFLFLKSSHMWAAHFAGGIKSKYLIECNLNSIQHVIKLPLNKNEATRIGRFTQNHFDLQRRVLTIVRSPTVSSTNNLFLFFLVFCYVQFFLHIWFVVNIV